MTQITENFEFQKLMDYDESGTLSGPMSPMMAANAIAKEFDIKFTGLVRWIYGENYDYLIMRRRYKNGRWFGLFIDMGVSITPVGQWFWKDDGSGDEFAMTTPLYRKMLTPEAQKEHYANCEKDERYDDPPIIELTDQTLTAMFRACEKQGDWKLNNKNYDDLGRVIKEETIVSEDKTPEYWNYQAKKLLEGRKIVKVRYMNDEEAESFGWDHKPLCIFFDDDSFIFPSMDDEGNNGGALFTSSDDMPTIPVMRESSPNYAKLLTNIPVENGHYHVECPQCKNWELLPVDEQRHHIHDFGIVEWIPDESSNACVLKCIICSCVFIGEWGGDNTVAVWDLRTDLRDMPESSQIEMYFALKDARDKLNGLNENTEALTSIIRQIISYNQNLENINDR
jgi:hypothetical protein